MNDENLIQLIYSDIQEMKKQQIITNERLDDIDRRLDGMDKRFEGIDRRLDRMDKRFDIIDERLDGMDKRFEGIDRRLDGMDKRFEGIDRRLDGMDKRFDIIDERLDGMDKRFEGIDRRLDDMDKRFDSLEAKILENTEGIRRINLCLENEIRPSIMRIAEGHLDLSRKLDEALKLDEEKEKMAIRLNFLEGKVDRLEVKVAALT